LSELAAYAFVMDWNDTLFLFLSIAIQRTPEING